MEKHGLATLQKEKIMKNKLENLTVNHSDTIHLVFKKMDEFNI